MKKPETLGTLNRHIAVWKFALPCTALLLAGTSNAQSCAPVTPPYTENFDAVTPPDLPDCMSLETIAGTAWQTAAAADFPLPFTGNVAFYGFDADNAADSWLYTQALNLTGGTSYRLSYHYGNDGGTTYPEKMDVYYGTDSAAGAMTNLLFDHGVISGVTNAVNTVDFTPATSGTYVIGFHAYSDADEDVLVLDEISVTETPSCETPSALAASNITTTSTDLSWAASASDPANGYQWELRTDEGNPGDPGADTSGTTVAGDTTAAATGLAAGTGFALYVRSDCGGGDFSAWTGPYLFTTLCNPLSLPFTENFEVLPTGALPTCWSITSNATGLLTYEAGVPPNSPLSGPSGAVNDTVSGGFDFYNVGGAQETESIMSAPFTPTPANYQVSFDATGAAYQAAVDSVYLETSTDGGGTWAVLQAMTNEDGVGVLSTSPATTSQYQPASATDWVTLSYPLPTGTNMLRFRGVSGFGNEVFFDNVTVGESPDVGIARLTATAGYALYPNPAQGVLNITTPDGSPVHATVYDMLGNRVLEMDKALHLDVANLPSGSYVIAISNEAGSQLAHLRFMKR